MKPKMKTQHQTKEVKSAQADFASTFEAFKDANDTRLAALESKQSDVEATVALTQKDKEAQRRRTNQHLKEELGINVRHF